SGRLPAGDVHFGDEARRMVGTTARYLNVLRQRESLALSPLLQRRLRIRYGMGHGVDLVAPQRSHDLTGSLETSFDENRPEEGLKGVGKYRLLLTPAALCLALAEDKIWSQPKLPCHARTGLPPHETIETAGKLS